MSKEPIEYLKHIRDECKYILSVTENDFTKDKLMQNETLKRAIIRSLEIIGEASKKIPADFKIKLDSINWKNMSGMRDRLIHDYMGLIIRLYGMLLKTRFPNYIIRFKT